jgi:hypothetical protein
MTYVDAKYQNDIKAEKLAKTISVRIFEASTRHVLKSDHNYDYGFVFPTNAEVLDYVLKNAKGKTILSIAGASGEEVILAALAGANRIVNNDLSQREIDSFKMLKGMAPDELQNTIEESCCSCLDLMQQKPDLVGQCDIIICNNLIHFFTTEQLPEFFKVVKALLAPNAKIIFTANTMTADVYKNAVMQQEVLQNPYHTNMVTIACLLRPRGDWRQMQAKAIAKEITAKQPEMAQLLFTEEGIKRFNSHISQQLQKNVFTTRYLGDSDMELVYKDYQVLKKNSGTGNKWAPQNSEIKALKDALGARSSILNEITNAYKNNPDVKKCKEGDIDVLKTYTVQYTPIAFWDIFQKEGFHIDANFLINYKGHTLNGLQDISVLQYEHACNDD